MLGSVLLFLNIGTPELILILFVALLLFGGDKLPGLAKGLGKGIRDFKDASEGVKREINNQIYNYEEKKTTTEAETAGEPVADAEIPADEKPLVDYTPVEGTVPVGGHQQATNIPADGEHAATAAENHNDHDNIYHEPATEHEKTTHE